MEGGRALPVRWTLVSRGTPNTLLSVCVCGVCVWSVCGVWGRVHECVWSVGRVHECVWSVGEGI